MESTTPAASPYYDCLICSTKTTQDDDTYRGALPSSETKTALNEEDAVFLVRIVLEIPQQRIEDNHLGMEWIITCSECAKAVAQAKLIYDELIKESQKFRNIQNKIVQSLKNSKSVGTTFSRSIRRRRNDEEEADKSSMEKCREFVNKYDYNGFTHPVLIQDFKSILPILSVKEECEIGEEIPDEDDLDQQESVDERVPQEDMYEELIDEFEKSDDVHVKKELEPLSDESEETFLKRDKAVTMKIKNNKHQSPERPEPTENPIKRLRKVKNKKDVQAELKQHVKSKKSKMKRKPETEENRLTDQHKANGSSSSQTSSKPFQCESCKKRFATCNNLRTHGRRFHGTELGPRELKFSCSEEGCSMQFISKNTFDRHLVKHQEGFEEKCSICGMNFYHRDELNRHKCTEHTDGKSALPEVPKEECPVCHNFYKNVPNLRKHIKRDHPGHQIRLEPNSLPCPWEGCDKIYTNKDTLEIHLSMHRGDPKYKCGTCEQRFYTSQKCRRHEEAKHGFGGPKICEICGVNFRTQSSLLQHLKQKHQMERRKYLLGKKKAPIKVKTSECSGFKCPICEKVFTKGSLQQHIRHVHEKKYHVSCEICQKKIMKGKLKHHKIAVHGIGGDISELPWKRPLIFQCPVKRCRMPFYGHDPKQQFDKHMEEMHPGGDEEKLPFICTHCGKGFWSVHKLRAHEMAHANAETKPFQCGFCGKQFATPAYLAIHERNIHKIPVKFPRSKKRAECAVKAK